MSKIGQVSHFGISQALFMLRARVREGFRGATDGRSHGCERLRGTLAEVHVRSSRCDEPVDQPPHRPVGIQWVCCRSIHSSRDLLRSSVILQQSATGRGTMLLENRAADDGVCLLLRTLPRPWETAQVNNDNEDKDRGFILSAGVFSAGINPRKSPSFAAPRPSASRHGL